MAKKEEKPEKGKESRKIWKWVGWISAGLVLIGVVVGFLVWWNMEGSMTDLERRGLPNRGIPVMEISLADGLELSEIDEGSKEIKYEGNEVTVYEDGGVKKYDNVEMKGRGNTTWGMPKKPYQIKFNKRVDLFGLGKAKKWVLLANFFDASYVRNDIAFMLAEMIGVQYSHKGDYVELYVDGDYRGLYYVVQKIEVDKSSVDLRGGEGLLFEIDTLHGSDEKCYDGYLGECLVLRDSKVASDEKEGLAQKFASDFARAEEYIKEKSYENAAQLLDMASFAKYFLVNEFTVNPDAYTSSFYLYRNDEGKIAAGPVWDFDFALANREWTWWTSEEFFSPRESMIRKKNAFGYDGLNEDYNASKLLYYLMDVPEFREEVEKVFREKMTGRKEEFIRAIVNRMKNIYLAAKMDGVKWERMDFETEARELINWVKARYDYFESTYRGDEWDYSGSV